MCNQKDKQLMIKFLEKNYPVSRIKYEQRFKRAIILDDGSIYGLSNEDSRIRLKYELMDKLRLVFDCDDIIISLVLNNFLNIK